MLRQFNIEMPNLPKFTLWFDPDTRHGNYVMQYFNEGFCYEPEVVHIILKALRPGDVVIDVGACIGFFSLLMSLLGASVIAVEPEEEHLPVLKSNAPDNVKIITQPLWKTAEPMTFYKCSDDTSSSALWDIGTWKDNPLSKANPQAHMRDTLTLDMIASPPVRLIKIDTEGTEQAILEGGTELLRSHPPFILAELNPNGLGQLGYSIEGLRDFMRGWSYDMFFLHFTGDFPSLVPPQLKIKNDVDQPVKNVLFSTLQDVAELWSEIEIKPYALRS